jgi:hypothetical protein
MREGPPHCDHQKGDRRWLGRRWCSHHKWGHEWGGRCLTWKLHCFVFGRFKLRGGLREELPRRRGECHERENLRGPEALAFVDDAGMFCADRVASRRHSTAPSETRYLAQVERMTVSRGRAKSAPGWVSIGIPLTKGHPVVALCARSTIWAERVIFFGCANRAVVSLRGKVEDRCPGPLTKRDPRVGCLLCPGRFRHSPQRGLTQCGRATKSPARRSEEKVCQPTIGSASD